MRLSKKGQKPFHLHRFPLEILDLIISIDSDLDLRDHVALAGTCRFFRTCYRDVVFQVLLQAAFPKVNRFCDQLLVSRDGALIPYIGPFTLTGPPGPFLRGYNAGRRIFSSGRSLVGAGGWEGWGLSRLDFEANIEESNRQKAELHDALREHWNQRPDETTESPERWARTLASWPVGYLDSLSEEALRLSKEVHLRCTIDIRKQTRGLRMNYLRFVHGLGPDLTEPESRYSDLWPSKSELERRDPWPSFWRRKVCEAVLNPSIVKTVAMKKYGIMDRDIKGLKRRILIHGNFKNVYYYTAAVESLALRLQSPSAEEKAYSDTLKARRDKLQAKKGIFTAEK